MTGNLVTTRVVQSQKLWRETSLSALAALPLFRNGSERRFTLVPSRASTAGSSVSVEARATRTTRIAPMPMDWKNDAGTITSPISAITTVTPLKSTVRPAVAPAFTAASRLVRPAPSSSLKRETTRSE